MPKITLIVGPPGCAKTTTLLDILEKEIASGIPARAVAFCSFTQMGSNVGRERAMKRFGGNDEDYAHFRTLHSLCFRALGLSRSDLMQASDYAALSRAMGMSFRGHYSRDMHGVDDIYLFMEQLWRNNRRTAYNYLDEINMDKFQFVKLNYPRYKQIKQRIDFTDMLARFTEVGAPLPGVKVAFIDEAQDLTTLQWRVALIAFRECERIYIAGDDDQAIFQWAGADMEYFQRLAPNNKVVTLTKSHRLPFEIHRYATRITDLIRTRLPKEFEPRGERGSVSKVNSIAEVDFSEGTFLVLSRNNVFLDAAEADLKLRGVLYTREGKKSVGAATMRRIDRYEKGELDSGDAELRSGAEGATPWWDAFLWDSEQIAYLKKVRETGGVGGDRVRLSTCHGVKGDEADTVVLFLDITPRTARSMREDPDAELRVYYVAATRARKSLILVSATGKHAWPDMRNTVTRVEKVVKKRGRRRKVAKA